MTENPTQGQPPEDREPAKPAGGTPDRPHGTVPESARLDSGSADQAPRTENAAGGPARAGYPQHQPAYGQHAAPATQQQPATPATQQFGAAGNQAPSPHGQAPQPGAQNQVPPAPSPHGQAPHPGAQDQPRYGQVPQPGAQDQPRYGQVPQNQVPPAPSPHGQAPHPGAQGQPPYGQAQYNQPPQGQAQHSLYPGQQPQAGPPFAPGSSFSNDPAHAPKRKAAFGVPTLIASILAAGLVGGGVAAGSSALLADPSNTAALSNVTAQSGPVIVNNKDDVNAITAAAVKASPSVVTIKATSGSDGGTGSGIILDGEGHVLTNTHVVTLDGKAARAAIEVRTSDGRVFKAQIVGTDPLSDLAVVKIEQPSGLVPATLGDSSKLNVGDTAVAIGSPLGLIGTVTDGIVSTLNRTISVASSAAPKDSPDESQGGDQGFQFAPPGGGQGPNIADQGSISINVIQTDAAINPGNSGGALVNIKGEMIGVNVAIASAGGASGSSSGNIGVGFSIPINHAKRVAQEIISTGKATHGQLGVSVKPKQSGSSSSGFSVGAEVATVEPGSAADKAGIRVGDVVTKFEDLTVSDPNQLTAAVREQPAGAAVTVTVLRGGQQREVDVTLGAAAEQ